MENRRTLQTVFGAALVVGTTYTFAHGIGVVGVPHLVWKGFCVGLLALWCGLQARSRDGWLITAVMALGALGDVLLEAMGITIGALAFLVGHLVAIVLYARYRRIALSASQRALAVVLGVGTPLIGWMLTHQPGAAVYATGLGVMAGMAWTSRFSRYRTGIGAVMFVASDLLIFRKQGIVNGPSIASLLIWPLYFAGQALIAWGVVTRLTAERGSGA